ncbi:MAG: carboxylesterase family protein [Paludibaculum sp.]
MRGQWKRGAPHATEIPYVFDTVVARYGKDLTAADQAIALRGQHLLGELRKNRNPNGAGLPEWPAYQPESDQLMDFAAGGPAAKPDPLKARLDLVEQLSQGKK